MSVATDTATHDEIDSGIGGWLGFVGKTFAAMPGQYRTALARHRGRTIGLTILFIALKLTGFIHWSWWWVLSPMWAGPLLALSVAMIVFVVVYAAASLLQRRRR